MTENHWDLKAGLWPVWNELVFHCISWRILSRHLAVLKALVLSSLQDPVRSPGVTTRAGFFEEGRGWGYQLKSQSRQISSVHWSLGANWSLATWKTSVSKHFLHVKKLKPNQAEMDDRSGVTTLHCCFLCSSKAGWKHFHFPLLLIWYFALFIGIKYT